jgi:hypothetical protein
LVGGRNQVQCLLSQAFEEQMGEGWSDFFGLITTAKEGDTEEQKRGIGTYVQFQDTEGQGYVLLLILLICQSMIIPMQILLTKH